MTVPIRYIECYCIFEGISNGFDICRVNILGFFVQITKYELGSVETTLIATQGVKFPNANGVMCNREVNIQERDYSYDSPPSSSCPSKLQLSGSLSINKPTLYTSPFPPNCIYARQPIILIWELLTTTMLLNIYLRHHIPCHPQRSYRLIICKKRNDCIVSMLLINLICT